MHVEQEVFYLRQRVAKLERVITFLMQKLKLEYKEDLNPVSPEISDLLQKGKKIAAIKMYREQTGAGLKMAKEFIESLE